MIANILFPKKISLSGDFPMKRTAPAALAVILLSSLALSQQPAVRPTPTPAAAEETGVVKISTNLIQLDVTVTDASGKVIRDLRRDEIQIFENGARQDISGFSFVSAGGGQADSILPDRGQNIAAPPAGGVRREQIHRTIAIVVDDLSLSFESIGQTRKTLQRFVNEQMETGDLVAILRTGAGVGSLQQFTSDKQRLLAAIDKLKWNPVGTGGTSSFAQVEFMSIDAPTISSESGMTEAQLAEERNRLIAFNDFRRSVFAAGTLGAIQFVIRGMSELPGRKSVLMFSDGFRLFERDRDGTPRVGRVIDRMRRVVDLANRASVVFYTIDPRGLAVTSLTAADDTKRMSPAQMRDVVNTRRNILSETQAGLTFLARETGGFAVLNNNDLSGGVQRALEDQSYYLIGYEPDESTFDAKQSKYNQIEVKVLRKGAEVRYRSGFFNVAGRPDAATGIPANATPQAKLEAALNSPFSANGLTLRLNSLFGTADPNGAYVRSLLHIDAKDLSFTDLPNGMKEASFDVLAACFGESGEIADQIGRRYTLTITPEVQKKVLNEGFVYHFKFPVKTPGAYQYRVAIRDSKNDRIGTASQFLAVPDLSKGELTVSSVVLENISAEDYERSWVPTSPQITTDPITDTALRRVRPGRVLRYAFEIYNAQLDAAKAPRMTIKTKVYREGKLILDSPEKTFDLLGQTDMKHLRAFGAIGIGREMEPGDYTLQIAVTDELARGKAKKAEQIVHFEVF